MSIRKKLLISFLILVSLASAGGIYSFLILTKASRYIASKETVYNILVTLEDARNVEKNFLMEGRKADDFLEDGKSKLTDEHALLIDSIKSLCNSLKGQEVVVDGHLETDVYRIQDVVSRYNAAYRDLVKLLFERGFKDYGTEGAMRDNVHQLQQCKSAEEKVFAFSLRRHEKDFMLRKDLKYYDQLVATASAFINFVERANMPHMTKEYKSQVISTINDYQKKFKKLVMLEEAIGLDENSGLQGKLNASANDIKPAIYNLLQGVERKNEALRQKAAWLLIISIFIPFVAGIVISIFLTRKIALPISSLNKIMRNIIKGKKNDLKKLDIISNKDEIGDLARNFREMMSTLNGHLEEISEKNKKLEDVSCEEKNRKWVAEGVTLIADLMKGFHENLNDLAYQVISNLVKYLNANQGGIFFVDDTENPTKMLQYASHAYDRKKFVQKEVLKGEGIIGAVWLEKSYTVMTDLPEDYVSITSGVGEATPRALLVMPIIHDGIVLGVIEIASFSRFDDYQIELVEKVAERIGSSYFSMITQEKTRLLLEQTQFQAEEMRSQEEELRQNMEELQATQEEMKRKQRETETVKKMLDNIIDLVPYPIFVKDSSFKYLLVNQAEAKLYNTSSIEMVGKDDSFFIKNLKELSTIRHSDSEVVNSKGEFRLPEQVISFPNGEKRILQTTKVPFINPLTKMINILGVSLDVTDVRDMQKELKFTREALNKAHQMLKEQGVQNIETRDIEFLQ